MGKLIDLSCKKVHRNFPITWKQASVSQTTTNQNCHSSTATNSVDNDDGNDTNSFDPSSVQVTTRMKTITLGHIWLRWFHFIFLRFLYLRMLLFLSQKSRKLSSTSLSFNRCRTCSISSQCLPVIFLFCTIQADNLKNSFFMCFTHSGHSRSFVSISHKAY